MKTKKHIQTIIDEIRSALEEIYGRRLKGIILYGSYARGEATEGSDIDILVLLENVNNFWEEREKIADLIWKLDLKYNTVISVLPVDEQEFQNRRKPIFINVKREGIRI